MRLAGFVLRRAAGVAPVLAALALGPASAISGTAGEPGWRVEAAFGAAHSFGSTLSLEQAGFPTLEINAEWESRSFESPPYYGLRVARQDARGAWAVRFVHLKVYLANPTLEVERFSVSHGYNLLTLERSFPAGGFELWAGLGLVIAHPESTVRGRTKPETEGGALGGGYYVTGPTGGLALGRRLSLGDRFALVPEVRFTLSRARVPIADREASVPNASVHFLLGLELRF
jgi:hypothetical protein